MFDVGAVFAILVLPLLLLVLFHVVAGRKLAPPPSPPAAQTAFAQFDFAGEAGELALARGQLVQVVRRDASGWSLVRLAAREGWVPDSFLGAAAPERVLSLDVECAATGLTHHDRAPCRVALVGAGAPLDLVVQVDGLVSPLTALTGLSAPELARGVPLAEARAQLRAKLGPDAVLVGQSIGHDLAWLGLVEGRDFKRSVDLGELFRCAVGGQSRVLSLEHEALALLGEQVQAGAHCPVEDAQVSLRLFEEWGSRPDRVQAARERLGQLVGARALPPRHRPPPRLDGVCMGRWSATCTCGR